VRGRFVVLEGGDGSGKSTQRDAVVAWLRTQGVTAIETGEPGGTDVGHDIRRMVLDGTDIDPRTEALLMAADRAEHCAKVIGPALAAGKWVVSDRFVPSSLVYQGVARSLGVDKIDALSTFATGDVVPDLVVVLDVDDSIAESRRDQEHDRLEREGAAFHSSVRQAYRALADEHGWTLISGNDAPSDVTQRIVERLRALLPT
jgi:dTMP kinase